jgi:hypothetical protein
MGFWQISGSLSSISREMYSGGWSEALSKKRYLVHQKIAGGELG